MDASTEPVADQLAVAADALVALHQSGYIVVAGNVCEYQRNEIEREFRVDGQILRGVPRSDQRVIAANIVGNIRHGLATGALVVVRDDIAAHVQATIRGVTLTLEAMRIVPSVWFDAPAEVASIIV